MKFFEYIKDKIISIILYIFEVLFISLLLYIFKVNKLVIIIIIGIELLCGLFFILYNYYRKKNFYDSIITNINRLDKKYYVLEMIDEPYTYEECLMLDILYDINKSMIENINNIENYINDFKEFVEIWIHEVKIPISSLVLKCHNNKNNYSKDFIHEVNRLDNYVDEVLYYVRSEYTEKDFVINDVNLKDVVKNVILKNKNDLLDNNINVEVDLNKIVVSSDSKWLEFIINQIINNSIKYKIDNDSVIKISCSIVDDKVILDIYDNGIGISKKDISRVFEKSFTGNNGRNKVKSTGMGLYIIKNLCDKLGHKIEIESVENKYTKVSIIFSINKFYKM